MDKLKPCPFCGSTDVHVVGDGYATTIQCYDCIAIFTQGEIPCDEDLIEAWNRRVTMDELNRLTCRDPEGRARLMPDVDLMAAIERLCQIEERGKGMLIMPRAERQVRITEALKRKWERRRSGNESQ